MGEGALGGGEVLEGDSLAGAGDEVPVDALGVGQLEDADLLLLGGISRQQIVGSLGHVGPAWAGLISAACGRIVMLHPKGQAMKNYCQRQNFLDFPLVLLID